MLHIGKRRRLTDYTGWFSAIHLRGKAIPERPPRRANKLCSFLLAREFSSGQIDWRSTKFFLLSKSPSKRHVESPFFPRFIFLLLEHPAPLASENFKAESEQRDAVAAATGLLTSFFLGSILPTMKSPLSFSLLPFLHATATACSSPARPKATRVSGVPSLSLLLPELKFI